MRKYLYSVILIFCVLFLGIHPSRGQVPKDTTLSAYTNQTVITAISSITLAPGFEIPEGKTVNIFTGVNFDNWVALSSKPSTDQNYILSRIFRKPGIKTDADASLNTYNTAEVNQTIQYFDGLGRSSQTIMVQASPKFSDVVQPVTYDAFGREDKKYQPYTIKDNGGTYRSDALTALTTFYGTPPAGIAATGYPYGQTIFEPSPLNRVVEQGAPGADWQPVSGANTGHTQKIGYGTNADEVKYWTLTASGASSAANYAAGRLYKTTTRDENGKSDLLTGSTDEYKDFEGHVVLKRVWENETKNLSTYYVYDDLGNLRYVIPPAVSVSSFVESDDVFKQFIYGYHYDGRKRLVEKQVPGKKWEYMVYNVLDQLVLTQDANQRAINQWVFTKYDTFGRVVGSGQYADAGKRDAIQATVDIQTVLWETRKTNDIGYDNLSFPQTASLADYYLINYYDDYGFPGVGTADQPSGNQVGAERTKSLLTGTRIRMLGTGTMLLSIHYYDTEGRMVQSKVENHLGGKDIIDNTYNFAGELTASNRSHTTKGNTVTTIANRYFYDHVGRKIATTENINGQSEVVLNKLDYTETGQLLSKQLHSTNNGGSYLQQTIYSYNERGWMTKSMSDQFNLQLKYNDGDIPQWNGNIANQIWGRSKGSLDNTFAYTYDPLNRLTKAVSPGLGENISYDVMGNIKTLDRDGKGTNTYSGYTGNQLTKITGFTNSEYSYDDNGNLTFDKEKNITLAYNYLNLPQTITGSQNLSYTYDAAGNKLKKTSGSETTDYIGGIQHKTDGTIDIIATEEGLARNNGGTYSYEYTLTDHLGNNRATFYKNPSAGIEVQQKDDYFAFGLRKAVLTASNDNKYLYNKKELQEELGQYDYGARFYDPVIGRWTRADNKAESYESISPYIYAANDPVNAIDPDGNLIIFVNGFVPEHFALQDNARFFGSGVPNGDYRPYPGSRDPSSGAPRYLGKSFDYWGNIDNAFMQGYQDNHALYINASSSNISQADDRFREGEKSANNLISQLDAGKISLAKGETIKIVGHSQGGAFAAGLAFVISKNKRYKSVLQEVVYLEPHQPEDFNHPSNIKGVQVSSENDKVASKNFGFIFKGGKTSYSRVKGIQKFIKNNTYEGDSLGGHSIGTNLDEIISYFRSQGVKVTVR